MSAELRILCPMCREVVVITPDAPGICPCGAVMAEVGEPYPSAPRRTMAPRNDHWRHPMCCDGPATHVGLADGVRAIEGCERCVSIWAAGS